MADPVRYLPPQMEHTLRYSLTDEQRAALGYGDGLWKIERLFETAFASGYELGYRRGREAGYEHGRHDEKTATERQVNVEHDEQIAFLEGRVEHEQRLYQELLAEHRTLQLPPASDQQAAHMIAALVLTAGGKVELTDAVKYTASKARLEVTYDSITHAHTLEIVEPDPPATEAGHA